MSISFGGLMSGLDTNSMISQLVALERQPINTMETRRRELLRDQTAIGNISSKLGQLEDAMEDFGDVRDFVQHSAKSSDEDAFTVRTSSGASGGNYDVEVSQLAKPAKMRSIAFTSQSDAVNSGTMTLSVFGEDDVDVDIPDGATLADVRDLINDSGADVDASIIDSGNGVYLSVTSRKSGHEVGGDPTQALTVAFSDPSNLGLATSQQAENAMFTVDGLGIERSSNVIDDAIEGLTFELTSTTDKVENVSVEVDREAVLEQVKVFVDAYNAAVDAIRDQSDDSFERRAEDDFGFAASRAEVDGPFANLAAIGITTGANGKLSIDETDLGEAIDQDPDAIGEIFADDTSGVVARMQAQIDRYTGSSGMLDAVQDNIGDRIDVIEDQMERRERSVESYEARLRRQFGTLEQLMVDMNDASSRYASFIPTGFNQS